MMIKVVVTAFSLVTALCQLCAAYQYAAPKLPDIDTKSLPSQESCKIADGYYKMKMDISKTVRTTEELFGRAKLKTAEEIHKAIPFILTTPNISSSSTSHRKDTSNYYDCAGRSMRQLQRYWMEHGWVKLTPCSSHYHQYHIDAAAAYSLSILKEFPPDAPLQTIRKINEFVRNAHVRQIAMDAEILHVFSFLTGHEAFPFQTLNFAKGTSQPLHNDLIHFSSVPQGLMVAGWVALEDIHPDSGPLILVPGSHKLGMQYLEDLGVVDNSYADYEVKLGHYIKKNNLNVVTAPPLKKGEWILWNAALLHGGGPVKNSNITRLSQVTHYYLNGATHYWVPLLSSLNEGKVLTRTPYSDDVEKNRLRFLEGYPLAW